MSFAIQSLQESIVATGGYVSEIDLYNRLKCEPGIILEALGELIHKGLVSKEYYEGKGHKVLGRFVGNTNLLEINPEIGNDSYNCSYLLTFTQVQIYEGKEYPFKALDQLFVGGYKGATDHAKEIKGILAADKDFQKVIYKIRKQVKR